MDISASAITFEFRSDTVVDAMAIIKLIQSEHEDGMYRMNGATGLRFTAHEEMELAVRLDRVSELLGYFAKNTSPQIRY